MSGPFKLKYSNSAFPFRTDNKKKAYKRIIKENNMKKDEKGFWVDSKGRTVSQIYSGVKGEQRDHTKPAGTNESENE